jgi:AbrB family looped-hinge helix DNA binding protein
MVIAMDRAITITIDKAGRLVLPREVRNRLHLQAGDRLEILPEEDAIHLRPVREEATVSRTGWLLVVDPPQGAEVPDMEALIEQDRELRAERLLGEWSSSIPQS